MLDVHPPHHPTHSWRDFFIHIATIVVGLFIAVGLEQTVEAIHHQHERHHLLEDMREEASKNVALCDRVIKFSRKWQEAATEWEGVLRAAPITAGMVSITIPADLRQREASASAALYVGSSFPTVPAWTTAKEMQVIGLLPAKTARFFDTLLYSTNWFDYFGRADIDASNEYASSVRVATGDRPGLVLPASDKLSMTVPQRDTLLKSLTLYEEAAGRVPRELQAFSRRSQAVADGVQNEEEFTQWSRQHPQR